MKQKSDALIGYQGANPFSDIQPRSFSDEKVSKEFYPTSVFWSLFNDQHEVLIGRRGSGKTFLLKMMRQSMLKTIRSPLAEKLVREKQYVAFYVPMQLEIVSHFRSLEDHANDNLVLFNYFFNSILAESILSELKTFFTDDSDTSIETEIKLAREICSVWFGSNDHIARIHTLDDIIDRVRSMYYAYDLDRGDLSTIPSVFRREICTPLVAITKIIARTLQLNDPTFIVCVDEAEFLNENMLKCINTVFRSNKDRIVLKVATLPFYYSTTKTLAPNCSVAAGHDFEYCLVDIAYDSEDYTQLTNKLCEYRIASRTPDIMVQFSTLEDFLGCVGKDALIDYYRAEFGKEIATRETIEAGIINSFSESRRQGANEYPQRRKTIYDKFAPIYFVRQMYLRSRQGNSTPGWYAGADVVRKITDGNPRLFIQLMNALFEKARQTKLTPKAQHAVIAKFAKDFCEATQGIEEYGPLAHTYLDLIGNALKRVVHGGPLVSVSCAFKLSIKGKQSGQLRWMEEAIAYSRVNVPEEDVLTGLTLETRYSLSFLYATNYWIPMRKDSPRTIQLKELEKGNSYIINMDDPQFPEGEPV